MKQYHFQFGAEFGAWMQSLKQHSVTTIGTTSVPSGVVYFSGIEVSLGSSLGILQRASEYIVMKYYKKAIKKLKRTSSLISRETCVNFFGELQPYNIILYIQQT